MFDLSDPERAAAELVAALPDDYGDLTRADLRAFGNARTMLTAAMVEVYYVLAAIEADDELTGVAADAGARRYLRLERAMSALTNWRDRCGLSQAPGFPEAARGSDHPTSRENPDGTIVAWDDHDLGDEPDDRGRLS